MIVRWTPEEAWLMAELARRALVVTPGQVRSANGGLELVITADSASVSLLPGAPAGHRWRARWRLEIDGQELAPGASIQVRRGVWRVELRTQQLATAGDVPLVDAALHHYTKQSTELPPPSVALPPWMSPTLPEDAPWWELDLGKGMRITWARFDLAPVPPGTRAVVRAYPFTMPDGAPSPGSVVWEGSAAETIVVDAPVVARFLRVELQGDQVSLAVTAAEVLAAELYEHTLAATLRRAFALHADRVLFLDTGETYAQAWSRARRLAAGLARRLEPAGEIRVLLMMRNRAEWVIADLAAFLRGYVVAAVAPDERGDRLARVLDILRPACVVADDPAGVPAGPLVLAADDLDAIAVDGEPPPARPRAPGDPCIVVFTSGSTGTPRGAVRTHAGVHAVALAHAIAHSPRHLSFQPLSHVAERMSLPNILIHGGAIAFSKGGSYLLDELRALEPTAVASVPRLFEALYARYRRRLGAGVAEAEARAEARAAFGRNLMAVGIGSAPVSAELLAFVRRVFDDVWVSEGYGTTELGSIAYDGKIVDDVEVRLDPEPRGEIRVRSPRAFSGYLGEPASFDADGFLATGDLGERDAEGRVRVVGRLVSTVKLAQGEFVSPDRIEAVLATAPGVDRVFVHAEPGGAGVAAVVVPIAAELERRGEAALLSSLRAHGRAAGLAAWEVPGAILVEREPFTVEAGLITVSGKLARAALAARYASRLRALAHEPVDAPPDDLVLRVAAVAARAVRREIDPHAPLAAAGVDSLAAAEILAALSDDLGREIPLAWWFGARTLAELAARLAGAGATVDTVVEDLALPIPEGPRARRGGAVLVTGATGFLGAHVVEALRARGREVVALVRAADDAAATARLAEALAARGIPLRPGDGLRAVAGDLTDLARVPDGIEQIVHCAATVSWLAGYGELRGPNVLGTLAMLGAGVPVVHVSTISVAPVGGGEDSLLPLDAVRAATPYVLTKWIAEHHARGAGATIHRPAMIAPHTTRGAGNRDDFLCRYLAGCVELGLYVDREDAVMDMTPVDFVAAAIAALPATGAIYHLVNVDQSPTYAAVGRALAAAGARVSPASYAAFRAALMRAPSRLRPLLAFFPEQCSLGMGPWTCAPTLAALAALGIERPRIDDAYIARALGVLTGRP